MSQTGSGQRRTYRSAEERIALLDAWVRGGMSAQAFERQHGLSKSSLWRWQQASELKRQKVASAAGPSISFAPVHITKAAVEAPVSERVIAEVMIGRDVRVRVLDGADISQVTLLVRALFGDLRC